MDIADLLAALAQGGDAPTIFVLAILIWRLEARLARLEKAIDIFGERLVPQVKQK